MLSFVGYNNNFTVYSEGEWNPPDVKSSPTTDENLNKQKTCPLLQVVLEILSVL